MPLIHYQGERLYARGLGAGVYLWRNGTHALSFGASYLPMSFDPADSDDGRVSRLDKRYSGLNLDLGYCLTRPWGVVSLSVSREVANDSGFSADASYSYPFMAGDFHLSPFARVAWHEARFADYYYGVSLDESRKSGLSAYGPDSGFNPCLGLSAAYSFTEHWSLSGMARVTFLSKEIKDSPMVDKSAVVSGMMGVNYKF